MRQMTRYEVLRMMNFPERVIARILSARRDLCQSPARSRRAVGGGRCRRQRNPMRVCSGRVVEIVETANGTVALCAVHLRTYRDLESGAIFDKIAARRAAREARITERKKRRRALILWRPPSA